MAKILDDAVEAVPYHHASAKGGQEKRKRTTDGGSQIQSREPSSAKRQQVSKRTHKNLLMRWMQAELEFYREASSNDTSKYTPWMSDNKKKPRDPPVSHLEAAATASLRGAFHFEVSKMMRNR